MDTISHALVLESGA